MIIFNNVTKTFDKQSTPIKDFSMHIARGQTAILRGESGSGKSTILSLTAGLMRPTSGDVTINGKQISKLPEHFSALMRREQIGIIFQSYHLIPALSVIENITVPLLPTKLKMHDITAKAQEIMETLNITDKAEMNVQKLSGGEQQRVAIARALINSPEIILADEPTANLDRKLTDSVIEIFRKLSAKGHTIIISTHDPIIAESGLTDVIINVGRE